MKKKYLFNLYKMAELSIMNGGDGEKGELKFMHHIMNESKNNGKVAKEEESIFDGEKGLNIKYFEQIDDKKSKYIIKSADKKTFILITIKGEKKDEKSMSLAELLKEVKGIKNLAFGLKYLEKLQKG